MTRLLLGLCATDDARYQMEYHHDLQSVIYNILRGSDYDVHSKQGCKFFCFSNIFPWYDLHKDDIRELMIASPNDGFISYLKEQLNYIGNIRIGRMKFNIEYCDKMNMVLPSTLITATPITSRSYGYRYEEMGMQELTKGYDDEIYYKSNHPAELFITQLERSLRIKYNQYYGLDGNRKEEEPIFYRFRFLKDVFTRLVLNRDMRIPVFGTTWEFDLVNSGNNTRLIQFILDTGLGERNSMGFGFMNPKWNGGGHRSCNN